MSSSAGVVWVGNDSSDDEPVNIMLGRGVSYLLPSSMARLIEEHDGILYGSREVPEVPFGKEGKCFADNGSSSCLRVEPLDFDFMLIMYCELSK